MTDDDRRRRLLADIARIEHPAHDRPHTDYLQQAGRHAEALDAHWIAGAEQRGLEAGVAGQYGEGPLPCRQIDEVANGDVRLGKASPRVAMPDDEQVLRLVERQRPQQHRFDDGEERRVRADPEGERDHRGRGERRFAAEDAEGVAEITAEHGEELLSRG